MKNQKTQEQPFIHLFTTYGGYYIFDVNTNTIIKTTKDNYSLLKSIEKSELQPDTEAERKTFIEKMQDKGLLSSNRVKEIHQPISDYLDTYLESGLQKICLQVTQWCNLRCDYCVYSGKYSNRTHTNKRMSFDTAKGAIDFLIEHSRNYEKTNIAFYGGEPILEFELIKKCINYAKSQSEGKVITFSLTTNGTLFTKEIIEFFMEHDVNVMISLDGPRDIHNKNRRFAVSGCGTFEKIDENLKLLRENYEKFFKENISFNVVLDSKNDFTCVNNFYTSYDVIKDSMVQTSYVSINYAKFKVDRNEKNDINSNYELFKLYLNILNRLDEKHVSKLVQQQYDHLKVTLSDSRCRTSSLSEKAHPGGPCVPGLLRLFVDVNGTFYPCERVDENSELMKIGNLEDGYKKEKIDYIYNIGKLTEDKCRDCWAFNYCTSCAAVADDNGELSATYKLSRCNTVKYNLEDKLRDYCILKEYGHTFEEDKLFSIYKMEE